jgi:CMP-N-acetylneuraminic acid synthetase
MIAIIPAKINSSRLENKNIYPVLNKPMIIWTIEAALKSKYITEIIISTNSEIILDLVKKYNVNVIFRDTEFLSSDDAGTEDVIFDVVKKIKYNEKYLVSLQANSPQITSKLIDEVIDLGLNNNLHDVRVYNENGVSNGSVWLIYTKDLFKGRLSKYCGAVINEMIDVHTLDDVKLVENLLKENL